MKNFKFTYGHGAILALITFMIFILTIIFYYAYSTRNSFDLVTKNYYEEELNYQQIIDAKNNTFDLKQRPIINVIDKEGIEIIFPAEFTSLNTKGKVMLYRPSADELDRNYPLDISKGSKMFILFKQFQSDIENNYGIYIVKLSWEKDNKKYYLEKEIKWK